MYLKAIELNGFKSFADKTRLSFEPGVTSVVGPNGSGKSNISDAIRWVMGEMSAKSLRGSNMQDVIFAGTQSRKPLGFAQVSIILDNSDHALNTDYDEVMVSRRVYRSGESEYSINGADCRLKDIHELFMDTGVGREGYSIIGQGKVNEIISGKADERRYIFDEAAGISKFRHRKNEAERKLLSTQDNLVRINDIVSELSGQLEPLKKQSEKARKYLDLREEMKRLEINIFMQSIDKLNSELKKIREDFETVSVQLAKTEKESAGADAEGKKLSELEDSIEAQIIQKRDEHSLAEVSAKGILGEIEVLKSNIESSKELVSRIERGIEEDKNRIALFEENEKKLSGEKAEKSAILEQMRNEVGETGKKSNELNMESAKLNEKLSALQSEVIEKMNAVSDVKSRISSLTAFSQSFAERKEAIQAEKQSMGEEISKIEKSVSDNEAALSAAEERAKNGRENLEKADKKIEELKKKSDECKTNLDKENASYSRTVSQLNMLREMERDYEGFAKSVKGILEAHEEAKLSGARVYGALSSLVGVSDEHVTAVEALLGGALQNVVVESEEDAKKAIKYLKENKMGRVTFLPVSSVEGRNIQREDEIKSCQGYIGIASELVHCQKRYENIIKNLLGRCVVVDTMDNAIAMSRRFGYKFRIATLEGELFNAGGSITGGSMNKSTGILSRVSQIRALEQKSADQKKTIDNIKSSMAKIEAEAESAATQRKGADLVVRLAEQETVRIKAEIEHIKRAAMEKKASDESMDSEMEALEQQLADTNMQLAVLINESTKSEMEIESANNEAAEIEKQIGELDSRKAEIQAALSEKNIELTEAKKDIDAIDDRISDAKAQIENCTADIEAKKKEIEEIHIKNENISAEIEKKEAEEKQLRSAADEASDSLKQLAQKRDEVRELIKKQSEEGKETREKVYALKEERNRIDAKREKTENEIESITGRIWEEYEVTYLGAKEYETDIGSISAAKSRSSELRSKIRSLGNVNVDAIEEYKAVSERYEFLSNQANDLNASKVSLEKLIDSIQEEMKKRFVEQFAIINEKFSQTFGELFGGGTAAIRLTDPSDVLGSGVEIDAQPPGKKLQNLSLLSGGEMAFCAIALLFAILKVRPTPFCVLDEIEAALDESNVYRFADYVKNYSKKTQFILVTHRRGTMETADTLYGVTMQEKGVSKLLELKLDEAVKMNNDK